MIRQVRIQYSEAKEGVIFSGKTALHKLSGLFERNASLLNRLSVSVEPEIGQEISDAKKISQL